MLKAMNRPIEASDAHASHSPGVEEVIGPSHAGEY